MQKTQQISVEELHQIVAAVYNQGVVVVKQAYSEFDCPTREFADAKTLLDDLTCRSTQNVALFTYAIYYPAANGYVYEKRIKLKPESCDGHTFRFTQHGWGLIQFMCSFRNYPSIECSISVNSQARARTWFDTYPDDKDPEMWDWRVVNKKAGRLIRLLQKCGKKAQ